MTAIFRIDVVRLDTVAGPVIHRFSSDLTVLAGDTGVGKTTLFELIKYGLGGDGMIAPVARKNVTDVHLDIRVGSERLRLSRRVERKPSKIVRVFDLITQEQLPDRVIDTGRSSIGDFLLECMGIQPGIRAAARGGKSLKPGGTITFNDVFQFMYVAQYNMNGDIAKSRDKYYRPKRVAVFELLFGLIEPETLTMWSSIPEVRAQHERATRELAAVRKFLNDSGVASSFDAQILSAESDHSARAAAQEIEVLQTELAQASDTETVALRELLAHSEHALDDALRLCDELTREQRDYAAEKKQVEADISRLRRMVQAGQRLARIEFTVCPRCTQTLRDRIVPDGACPVCFQQDIVPSSPAPESFYELDQLGSQLTEVNEQLVIIERQLIETLTSIENRQALVRDLAAEIGGRTSDRVTPRVQALAEAITRRERALADHRYAERLLAQWDRVEDLEQAANSILTQIEALRAQVREREAAAARRKYELLHELSQEFESTVLDFGIPGVTSARIDPQSYLPILDDQPFNEVSAGGGIITATQIAYWLTLVTVAARQRDTNPYPAFLLIDSPQLALSTSEGIAAQMYRRFRMQADVTPGRLQFIVADNRLPAENRGGFAQIDFSYTNPTVTTIKHPGKGRVRTLTATLESDSR